MCDSPMEASVFFLASLALPLLPRGLGLTIVWDVAEQNGAFASLQKAEIGSYAQKSYVAVVQGSHLVKTVSCCQDYFSPVGPQRRADGERILPGGFRLWMNTKFSRLETSQGPSQASILD